MTGKTLEAQLVKYYWGLDDAIDLLIAMGNINIEEILILRNQQAILDKILTNISKRWSEGKRDILEASEGYPNIG